MTEDDKLLGVCQHKAYNFRKIHSLQYLLHTVQSGKGRFLKLYSYAELGFGFMVFTTRCNFLFTIRRIGFLFDAHSNKNGQTELVLSPAICGSVLGGPTHLGQCTDYCFSLLLQSNS